MSRGLRLLWTLVAAAVAFIPGGLVGAAFVNSKFFPEEIESVPLPHHIPKSANVVSFRFAMAHDVIHERFPKHGPAFYRERERLAREKLASAAVDFADKLVAYDDIAAGLERQSKSAEAVDVMRQKLATEVGRSDRDMYTTYANLGTFLMHANMPKAIAGDAKARAAVEEGLDFVRKSVRINPDSHFGREQWQIVLGEFLLAACDDPTLMTKFDFVGNRVDLGWKEIRDQSNEGIYTGNHDDFGRPSDFGQAVRSNNRGVRDFGPQLERIDRKPDRLSEIWNDVSWARGNITKIGAEKGWDSVSVPTHRKSAPFDEPMLGIIGMWRQGGGANPHFALAIGEIMLRVGQRRIAWTAYERAKPLAGKFWPKPEIQHAFRDHCNSRQKEIEATLSPDEAATLRPKFEEELAYGLRYQREYQEYEAVKIAAGANIADEHFFDAFHANHEPIASPSGPEEWYVYRKDTTGLSIVYMLCSGVLGSAAMAFLTSAWLFRRAKA
jgi:hypothetical protein